MMMHFVRPSAFYMTSQLITYPIGGTITYTKTVPFFFLQLLIQFCRQTRRREKQPRIGLNQVNYFRVQLNQAVVR